MASGAKIIFLDDCVIKVNGGNRIDRQAEWLEQHQCTGVVKILGRWHGGYAMERLDTPTVPRPTAGDVITLLMEWVWEPTYWNCNWDDVLEYALERSAMWWPEVTDDLQSDLKWCTQQTLTTVITHGDPTYENVLSRNGRYVLIDPLPPEPHTPSLLALDLGKILQSFCGYENALIGIKVVRYDASFLRGFDEIEQRAALTFALYHIVRLLPYLPDDDTRTRIKEVVGGNVLRLRSRWHSD